MAPFYGAHEWMDGDWEMTKAMILNPDTAHCPDPTSLQDPEGSEDRARRYVFGLGLSKTGESARLCVPICTPALPPLPPMRPSGTTSLHTALNTLGYRDMEGQVRLLLLRDMPPPPRL